MQRKVLYLTWHFAWGHFINLYRKIIRQKLGFAAPEATRILKVTEGTSFCQRTLGFFLEVFKGL